MFKVAHRIALSGAGFELTPSSWRPVLALDGVERRADVVGRAGESLPP
jgi:hypothetical protein